MMDQDNPHIISYYCWDCKEEISFNQLERLFRELAEKEDNPFSETDLPRVRKSVRLGGKVVCPKCRKNRCNPIIRCLKCKSSVKLWGDAGILLAECESCGQQVTGSKEVLENVDVRKNAIEKYLSKNPEADVAEISGHLKMERHTVRQILNSRGDN